MPRALRLPLAHVDCFAEQPRTCHEYYAFLAGQTIRSVDPVSRGDVLFAIEWTLAASQHGTNDITSSILALPMEGIRKSTPAFKKWQTTMLNCTLGQELGTLKPAGGGGERGAHSRFLLKSFCGSEKSVSDANDYPPANGVGYDAGGIPKEVKWRSGV